MARLIGLEWSETEARVAVAAARGAGLLLEHAFTIDLVGSGASEAAALGARLAEELTARRIGRGDTLVAIGRGSVELRQLNMPAAPDDELPDLVRFQALREFNNLEDDWPLDFLPLEGDAEHPRSVLAAAVRPELVAAVREACEAAGLKPVRMVLRPCATASLVVRRSGRQSAPCLFVGTVADEVDMAVIVDGQVTFLRQTRLPGDPLADESSTMVLFGELRRTLAAAHTQPNSPRVDKIILCGHRAAERDLAATVSERLGLACEVFDPLSGVTIAPEAAGVETTASRFAPLLGMLSDEIAGAAPALDFLQPRRRAEPPSRRNTYALAGLAAGILVLGLMLLGWVQGNRLRADVRSLQLQSKALDKSVDKATKIEAAAGEIGEWVEGEINWLDELRWLSEKLPTSEDAVLTQLKMSVAAGRAEMTLDGLARDDEAAARLDRGLNDDAHRLAGKSKNENDDKMPYEVQFRSSLLIERPGDGLQPKPAIRKARTAR